ncbi:MAG: o-succinylbenzoate synthase [Pirellulaceae bacterium]|nr:o-succinylbenzoate synthase [Pirellulaceae bacterium]
MCVCVVGFRFYRYCIPLAKPLRLHGEDVTTRAGILVHSEVTNGWGDASPLPGFSVETFDDVLKALPGSELEFPPSLRFAIDSANNQPIIETDRVVPVNALLMGDWDSVLSQAEAAAQADYRSVKLKVGRQSELISDIELVKTVDRILRPDQTLRLDANRAWRLEQAVEFANAVRDLNIEYIEEPTEFSNDLESFFAATEMPYALDETLLEQRDLLRYENAAALIVKPTLLGGVKMIRSLLNWGLPLTFSSCFESGVGILNVARWAADYAPHTPAGLDTYHWLQNDLLADSLDMSGGQLSLTATKVDLNRIEEVVL